MAYPKTSLQYATGGTWWEKTDNGQIECGRLIWTVVPFVNQEPRILKIKGRNTPTTHSHADYAVETAKSTVTSNYASLPVAAFPNREKETLSVYRAKERPAIVLSTCGPKIPKELRRGRR